MISTPTKVHIPCFSGRSYGLSPRATDSTDDAEATWISPIPARVSTADRMTGLERSPDSSPSQRPMRANTSVLPITRVIGFFVVTWSSLLPSLGPALHRALRGRENPR